MNIIIPDPIDIPDNYKQKLRDLGATVYDDVPKDRAELIDRIKDAGIITANYIDMTPETIDGAPKLKYIIAPAVGYEWIDVAYATSKGVATLNCPAFNSSAVAEHALALLLAVSRRITNAAMSLEEGRWDHVHFTGMEIQGKRLGLIGYGNIGRRLEKLVSGFEMRVSYVNSKSSPADVDKLIRESDVVCVCAPLTERTRHLLDKRRLALFKPEAILINVGRGAIIDQPALADALTKGVISGAGLDVFEDEPLAGKPNESIVRLARLPNVVATPHMAYNTYEAAERLGYDLYEAVQACLAGHPVNVVLALKTCLDAP